MYKHLVMPTTFEEKLKFIDDVSNIIHEVQREDTRKSLYHLDYKIIGTYGYYSEYRNIAANITSIEIFKEVVSRFKSTIYTNLTSIARNPDLINHLNFFRTKERDYGKYLNEYNKGVTQYYRLWDNRLQFLKDYLKLPSYYEYSEDNIVEVWLSSNTRASYKNYYFSSDFCLDSHTRDINIEDIPKWAPFVKEFLSDHHPHLLL